MCEGTIPQATLEALQERYEARFETLEAHMKSSHKSLAMDLQEAEQERVALGECVERLEEESTSLQNKVTLFPILFFGISYVSLLDRHSPDCP